MRIERRAVMAELGLTPVWRLRAGGAPDIEAAANGEPDWKPSADEGEPAPAAVPPPAPAALVEVDCPLAVMAPAVANLPAEERAQQNRLLANMLASIGLDVRRLPLLRVEDDADGAAREVARLRPGLLLVFGETLALRLLPDDGGRGGVRDYHGRRLLATLDPGHLLAQPLDKALAWQDLKALRDLLDAS